MPPGKNNNIVEIIRSILEKRETVLDDHTLEDTVTHLFTFKKLVEKFDLYDQRKNETGEQSSRFRDQRNHDRNRLVSILYNAMRSKIEQFEQELSIAEKIQRKIVPETFPHIRGYEIEGRYHPSHKVGGDYYDYFLPDDDTMLFLIADVAGHGIPATLVVSGMQAYISAQVQERKPIDGLITSLNRYLAGSLISGWYVSMFLGILDFTTGIISYINAGHHPPVIIENNRRAASLTGGGLPLGFLDSSPYTIHQARLREGAVLALYTDGAPETANEKNELFSLQRLVRTVKKRRSEPLGSILTSIFNELREFNNGAPFQDDIAFLFIKRRGRRHETKR